MYCNIIGDKRKQKTLLTEITTWIRVVLDFRTLDLTQIKLDRKQWQTLRLSVAANDHKNHINLSTALYPSYTINVLLLVIYASVIVRCTANCNKSINSNEWFRNRKQSRPRWFSVIIHALRSKSAFPVGGYLNTI